MAAKVVSILNNKGGVGKTTSTAFFGEITALFGKKTLLIDTDESGNLSYFFNQFQEDSKNVINGIEMPEKNNIAEIFKYRYTTEDEIATTIYKINENLDIIPASKRFKSIPDMLLLQSRATNMNNNIILKKAVKAISNNYDFIFIDTAPENDIITVNSLMASDGVVIPVQAEGFSIKGLKETIMELSDLMDEYDISTEFLGAFQTTAETNTTPFKESEQEYYQLLGTKSLPCIRKDIAAKKAIQKLVGDDLIKFTLNTNVLYDYCMLLIAMNILDKETENLILLAYESETAENSVKEE